ncbi:hypothetical protein HY339_01330 [Candidatus Gottesmanbacteria bacterium]|nr:hypothetical protein [Candidatus Gottesmanbacteria bacterium]
MLSRREFLKLSGAAAALPFASFAEDVFPNGNRSSHSACDFSPILKVDEIDLPADHSLTVEPTHDIGVRYYNTWFDSALATIVGIASNEEVETHRLLEQRGLADIGRFATEFDRLIRVPAQQYGVGEQPKPAFAPFDAVVMEDMKGTATFPIIALMFTPDIDRVVAVVRSPYIYNACDYGPRIGAPRREDEEEIISLGTDNDWHRARKGGMIGFLSVDTRLFGDSPGQTSVRLLPHAHDRSESDEASPALFLGITDRLQDWNGFPVLARTKGNIQDTQQIFTPDAYRYNFSTGRYELVPDYTYRMIRGNVDVEIEAIITAAERPLAVVLVRNWASVSEMQLSQNAPRIVIPVEHLAAYTPWEAFYRKTIGPFLPYMGVGALIAGITSPAWSRTIYERMSNRKG